MKSTLRLVIALLLFTFSCSTHVCAWSDPGHMAVAFVAYKNLDDATRKRVDALIKLNPRYDLWVKRLPSGITDEKTRNGMLFMIAATWADQIKGDHLHVPDGPEGGNRPPTDGSAIANIGYADKALHKYWHFIDLPVQGDTTPTLPPDIPNALTQIAAFRAMLAMEGGSDELKSYDLVWLMHLVGDVHQPLHCAARFNQQFKTGDSGGNFVTVCDAQCVKKFRLHEFWDGLLGSEIDPDPNIVISRAQGLPAPDPARAANLDANTWINESFALAEAKVYRAPIGPGKDTFPLTPAYQTDAVEIAKDRIALAGARLANILNKELR